MRRRDILAGAGSLATVGTSSLAAPTIAQGIRHLKMVTDWPESLPGLQASAVRFARTVEAASGGSIKIEVFPAGALVRPFETFDAVEAGVADMYQTYEGYFEKKSPTLHFFTALPFGLTPTARDELSYLQFRTSIADWGEILFAWVLYGGAQELWDVLSEPAASDRGNPSSDDRPYT